MDITLDKQLKALRKERNVTQEELANHLGITVQAVSKWERAEGLPDISLLPSIASFFNISIDTLLGVDEIEKERKIDEYLDKEDILAHEGKTKEMVELWREAQKEFPNDHRVWYFLMYALLSENKKAYADEIISLGERLLNESTDNNRRSGAIQCLAFAYSAKGDIDKAKEYANMSYSYSVTVNELMPILLSGEEAVEYCQHNIQQLFEMIWRNGTRMANNLSTEGAIKAYQFILNSFELLYEDGDLEFYHCEVEHVYRALAKRYKSLNQIDKMLDALENAAEHSIKFDLRKDGKHTSFMVNRIEIRVASSTKNHEENQSALFLRELNSEFYSEFQNDVRVKAIKEKLEKIAVY